MFKILKIVFGLAIGFLVLVFIANKIDAPPSENLTKYQSLKANHKVTNKHLSMKKLLNKIINQERLVELRKGLKLKELNCFAQSTCSNSDYTSAIGKASILLDEYTEVLSKLNEMLRKNVAVTLSRKATVEENLFLSLDTIIKLKLIEINYTYSKVNSDKSQAAKATEEAILLNNFITKSLSLPNFSLTAILLTSKLEWLRESIQKYSPNKLDLPRINSFKIIEAVKLGEFIVFSNLINKILKKPKLDSINLFLGIKLPSVFVSKNRTLNLFTELNDEYAESKCVTDEKQKFCSEISRPSPHLINPGGTTLVNMAITSPLHYKKINSYVTKINAINL